MTLFYQNVQYTNQSKFFIYSTNYGEFQEQDSDSFELCFANMIDD